MEYLVFSHFGTALNGVKSQMFVRASVQAKETLLLLFDTCLQLPVIKKRALTLI